MTTDERQQPGGADLYAYRYVVEGRQRAAAYAGPLAWVEGRLYVDGAYGEVTVRLHDAGQLGTVRREAAEHLALNYRVRARQFDELVSFSRQGGRFCGEELRRARHALKISGDALKVARFAAELPQVLAAIERAATATMRTLGRWVRDSAHGQRWADTYDARHRRTERRYLRRSYIRHLSRWIGPDAPQVSTPMPDWSENWLSVMARIAQATAAAVDISAARDHMAEALLYAQAHRAAPHPVQPLEASPRRYASVYDAIHAPAEQSHEIGDVEFCHGDPDEPARNTARQESAAAEETPAPPQQSPRILTVERPALGMFPADDTAPEFGVFHVAGPGVIGPGTHVQYRPGHQPGPRTRHAHGGVIESLGRRTARWRPYGHTKAVRSSLEALRVTPHRYPVYAVGPHGRLLEEIGHTRPWTAWSLAEHLAHGRRTTAPATMATARPAVEPRPAEQLALPLDEPATTTVEDTPAAPGPVVVIPCSGAKLDHAAEAGQLYTGALHRQARKAADALTADGGTTLVLSALHGFLPLDQVIKPYDHQWNDPGSITVPELRDQAARMGLADARHVVLLTPSAYTQRAAAVWPQAPTPLAHLGIGQQLGRLAVLRTNPAQYATAA
ncbi:DUF6884 domain-containing protein [Streptomyces canus]|uniref:DUF6884 domain-containing protein n=1 Tax=Streptomyces canus TaxID=58343 RepID=UPI002E254597|nr:DUF6884 domain-containing protein [Streptomyces canus]